MDRERERLRRLEEEAARQGAPVAKGRTRPSSQELDRASDSWDGYFAVWARHGWSRSEVEEELAIDELVRERCEASGFEDWMIIKDMIAWFESRNLPYPEMEEALHGYPGPGFWAGGRWVPNGQMRLHHAVRGRLRGGRRGACGGLLRP